MVLLRTAHSHSGHYREFESHDCVPVSCMRKLRAHKVKTASTKLGAGGRAGVMVFPSGCLPQPPPQHLWRREGESAPCSLKKSTRRKFLPRAVKLGKKNFQIVGDRTSGCHMVGVTEMSSPGLHKLPGNSAPFHVFCRSCEGRFSPLPSLRSFPSHTEHLFRSLPHLGSDTQQLQSWPHG